MSASGLLFSEMTPAPDWAEGFHEWYDTEHIPLRMAVPGFTGAQRYKADGRESFLAVYDMEDPQVLATPAYKAVKDHPSERTRWMLQNVGGFTRYTCRELDTVSKPGLRALGAPVLYAVSFTVPGDRLDDFDQWYAQDHVPTLMKCAGWQMVRRFEVVSGEPASYNRLALHYITSKDNLDSPERAEARASPWRARLAAEDWFRGDYQVFHKWGDRQKPGQAASR